MLNNSFFIQYDANFFLRLQYYNFWLLYNDYRKIIIDYIVTS